jgi:hypothetical protein
LDSLDDLFYRLEKLIGHAAQATVADIERIPLHYVEHISG